MLSDDVADECGDTLEMYAVDYVYNRLHGLRTPVGVRDFLFSILVRAVRGAHLASSAKSAGSLSRG